jgi:hypothetical protein
MGCNEQSNYLTSKHGYCQYLLTFEFFYDNIIYSLSTFQPMKRSTHEFPGTNNLFGCDGFSCSFIPVFG